MGKESNEIFMKDMGKFFMFTDRIRKRGLVTRHGEEPLLKPFDVLYPMGMSAEQTCFDLGGACKAAEYVCIKCSDISSNLLFCWPTDSEFICEEYWCVGERFYHMAVGDNKELNSK